MSRKRKKPMISRLRRPADLSLEDWQIALRRQFAKAQNFRVRNAGRHPVFSDFHVTNPTTRRTYRVAIRGLGLGENFCSCPDFAGNTLGTCKHIEFLLARLRRNADARRLLAAGYQPPYSEVYVRYGAKREVIFRAGRDCPPRLGRLADEYFDPSGRLRDDAFGRFEMFIKEAAAGGGELRCYEDAMNFVAQVRDRAALAERIAAAFPDGGDSEAFGRLLKASLYPYQREGALFAARAGRCLLADDMGLGKTIQAIAASEILARTDSIERVLIVCPTSLKHQWRMEIEKFAGRSATVVEGMQARRFAAYAADSFFKIVNYDVVHSDLEAIGRWRPDLVILDEAQRIKNWKTRAAQAVKRIDSDHAIVLTGTPLENRLEELYSIVEFVDRFRLGPMFRFLAAHQHVDETGRVIGYRNLSKIAATLAPILIRRRKEEVLKDLPERLEKRFFVPMTDQQMASHEENREIVARIVAKWRRYGFLSDADQRRLTAALQNMRMSCNSTYLLDGQTDHGVKADEIVRLLGEVLEQAEAKVVIFSQWVRTHELIIRRLGGVRTGHVFFHGGVPGPKRKDLVMRFREDPRCRLFLSTDAGGVGLNLQVASTVINVDQPWNPAVLEQRIGRVHRLGQRRPVSVVHFIAKGTIEEGMLSLLKFKKSVFAGVLDGGQDEVFMGGTRLKRFMESVESATGKMGAPLLPSEPEAKPAGAIEPASAPAVAALSAAGAGPGGFVSPHRPGPRGLADLLVAGASWLTQLAQTIQSGAARPADAPRQAAGGLALPVDLVRRDQATGRPYLHLPMPDPNMIGHIVGLLGNLAEGVRGAK